MVSAIEVLVDNDRNRGLFFQPLQRIVRGVRDLSRDPEPEAGRVARQNNGKPIPGQVIGLEGDVGYIRDAIHDDADLCHRVQAMGMKVPDEREDLGPIDRATWLYWLRRAVDAGHAQVIAGKLPELDKIDGEPQKTFQPRPKSPTDERLDALVESQEKLLGVLTKLLDKK